MTSDVRGGGGVRHGVKCPSRVVWCMVKTSPMRAFFADVLGWV